MKICDPSRDQAGSPVWLKSPVVIWRGAPPVAGITNTWEKPLGMTPAPPIPSERQRRFVTAVGGSAHFAPGGCEGILMDQAGLPGTRLTKATDCPLGAQDSAVGGV